MTGVSERLARIQAERPIPEHPAEHGVPASSLDAELRNVNFYAREMQNIEAELEHAIARATTHGATWAMVGQQLGTTKQAAQQRWSRRIAS